MPLSELPLRARGVVARVSDRDAAVLRAVTAAGVRLDSEIAAGSLPSDIADAVWVVRVPS